MVIRRKGGWVQTESVAAPKSRTAKPFAMRHITQARERGGSEVFDLVGDEIAAEDIFGFGEDGGQGLLEMAGI